ncbi:MAG: TonB-dependent receptor [Chitinophagaceae bacterium]|nr:TonB-dependent receptor [Chitinophagaceae bacterium]MCA6453771.1 TonB-dependent receptor [Chitinophagaceae bacterium]MCA6456559.1 TonB-dependent receptor [Chitinophagaceae bacterium]MCA6458336.1 TonB-dependent receptor [Chitinophagaceae bacterium]MCA6466165.1 TonB-dependent receptor [Chitinophagaceae bacterium]
MVKLLDGTGISYQLLGNDLVVLNTQTASGKPTPPPVKVTGRVVGADGAPVAGASVVVKGSKNGTAADADGRFTLTVADDAVLVVSAIGYVTQEVSVGGRSEINLTLQAVANNLNEVVVIGYGTASKRDLTGSIVKVDGKEIADKPNVNPVSSLQGKVAGLSVVASGTPGAEPDIRIRGTVSIGAVKPLYVVDGIFNDNIDYINPNDIESIEVLKDPSSLAIFGVRGASGVIALTTKKAKAGQLVVNFNSSFGTKQLVDKIKMVDAAGFKLLFDEEQTNIGVPVAQRFDYSKWTGNTDWVKAMTRTAIFNSNNISLTSSTEKNKFYMGVGYITDEGVVKHEKLDKLIFNVNDELRVSKSIKFGFNLNAFRQKLPFSQADGLLYDARRVLPITEPFNAANGVYTQLAIQAAQIGNPLMNLENKWDKEIRTEFRTVGSVYAEVNFLRNFTLRSTFFADISNLEERRYNPIINVYNPTVGASGSVFVEPNNRTTSVNQGQGNWKKFQQDHILTFKKSFGDHGLTAIAGFTTYFSSYNGLFGSVSQRVNGDAIPNDKRFWYVDNGFGDPTTKRSSSAQWERATVSSLFRVLYNYKGKYLLNGSFRRDGSSQISPFNRFKNFYSVGAAWELTKEKFMEKQNVFNFFKLKASWGILGVQNTYGYDYPFYPALQSGNTAVFGSNIVPAYSLSYEPQRDLTWETVNAKEIGFEFYALNNRLHAEAAYYDKTTKDIMTIVPTGSGRYRLDNVGDLRNKGFEFSAGWNQKLTKDWSFAVNANITTFNNKVVDLGGNRLPASEERPNQTEAGYPIGYFYGYVVEGLYQSYADKLASPKVIGYDYGPGDFKYKDINGDGVIDTKDRTMIGNPTPDFMYGISLQANYKGFDFGVDFNGVYGNEIYRYWGSSELPFTTFNYPAFKLNRWTGEGTSNWDPILGANHTINRLPSTYGIEDGSYFRIRNIQLGYNFKPELLKKVSIKSIRVFANVQNLKTFKRNSGYTPEFGGTATSFGIDNGNGPVPLVFTGGINVTF